MNFEEFAKIVRKSFPEVTERQMRQFEAMDALYREWNAKINVISRKDMDSLYDHHILHSLAIASYVRELGPALDASDGLKVLDLGTGGGFPGIPLAVMFPGWQFTLCDSIGKKVLVAGEVSRALGLDNVKTVHARAESLPGSFDVVVSRAVTSLDNFYPWVRDKFTRRILVLKGGDINAEISSMLRKFRLNASLVHSWRVDSFIEDEYFAEKFVIDIEKS